MSKLGTIIHTELVTIETWIKDIEIRLGLVAPPAVAASIATIKAAAPPPSAPASPGNQAG